VVTLTEEADFHKGVEEMHICQYNSESKKSAESTDLNLFPRQNSTNSPPSCPSCHSDRIWKDGLRRTRVGDVQRWLCRKCGFRFSESSCNYSEGVQKVHRQILNYKLSTSSSCQVCVSEAEGMINLAEVETRTQEKAAGATTQNPAAIKGKLIEFAFWMSKEGLREATIKGRVALIRRLADLGADLWNPETVKEVIAKQKTWSEGQKVSAVTAYNTFLEMEKLTWKPPRYKYQPKLPFIPTEAELDQLIIACGKRTGTFLQGLKDTGADPGELGALRWIDINNEARTVAINYPVKNHNPRILSVSDTFIKRVNMLPKNSERIFKIKGVQSGFYNQQRKTAAYKLGNPRLLKISFITFRHWKGTMEYHRTKDILYVKRILGHKSIQNTLVYIDLEANLFTRPNEEFTARVATNTKEACNLIEVGFEYVTGEYEDGGKIFRKRK